MPASALLTKNNLLLLGGAIAIIALGFLGFKIATDDPAKSTREAYKNGGVPPRPVPTATPSPTPSPSPLLSNPSSTSILPGGATPTPAPTPDHPGVVESTNQEVVLPQSAPVTGKNIFTSFPPVPETIMAPSLSSHSSDSQGTNTQPIVRIAPSRFLFNNQSPDALTAATSASDGDTNTKYNPSTFAPMGETIQLAMMENSTTENTEINVTAAVWEPFYFGGRKLLNVGDKVIGVAKPGKNRDRMVVKFDKIILKDGRSIPIDAIAQDVDGTYGVKGYIVGSKMLNSIAPVLLAAASSFAQTLQQQVLVPLNGQQGQTYNGLSGLAQSATQTASAGTMVLPTAKNAGLAAGSTVFQKISELLSKDIEENKPYLVVPAGTRLQAFLTKPIDTSIAEYGK